MKGRRQDTKSEPSEKLKDALRKLRGENRQLKKRVAQLQSELNKSNSLNCLADWDEDEPIMPAKKPEETPSDKCPKCKAELTLILAGIFEVRCCSDCGWKKRKKVDYR